MRLLARALLPALLLLPGLSRAATESISQLPAAATVNLGDIVPCTQGSTGPGSGTTRKCAVQQVGTALGLGQSGVAGTMAQQNSGAVAITGGTVSGVTVSLGDLSGANVTATGSTTARTLAARAGEVYDVQDFGAVPDATGSVGVGTDDTAAFQAALNAPVTGSGGREIIIGPGRFRVTSTLTLQGLTTIRCAGHETTYIEFDEPTGTQDLFYVNNTFSVRLDGCNLQRLQAATSGALFHAVDTGFIWLEHNRIGNQHNHNAHDGVKIEAVNTNVNEIYSTDNKIEGLSHDAVYFRNHSTAYAIADVFFQGRNYLFLAQNAGMELDGGVGLFHSVDTDFDQNTNYGLLIDNSGNYGSYGAATHYTFTNSHFEGNTTHISATNITSFKLIGNEFLPKSSGVTPTSGMVQFTNSGGIVSAGNLFDADALITLSGVAGFTDSSSRYDTLDGTSSPITVGPSGTTPSSSITIDSAIFPFSSGTFLTFTGSSNPATNVSLKVTAAQGTCWTGANVDMSSFTYTCGSSTRGDTTSGLSTKGDVSTWGVSTGILGNLYQEGGNYFYGANTGSGGYVRFGGGSQAVTLGYAPYNGSGANSPATVATGAYLDTSGYWHTSNPAILPGYTVATLPTCNSTTKGGRAYVTDATAATYNAAPTGGGSTVVEVFCTGSAWTMH